MLVAVGQVQTGAPTSLREAQGVDAALGGDALDVVAAEEVHALDQDAPEEVP